MVKPESRYTGGSLQLATPILTNNGKNTIIRCLLALTPTTLAIAETQIFN